MGRFAEVSGTVTDAASGTPLTGIDVTAFTWEGAWEYAGDTSTDSTGAYFLDDFYRGTYKLRFRDSSGTYRTEFFNDKARHRRGRRRRARLRRRRDRPRCAARRAVDHLRRRHRRGECRPGLAGDRLCVRARRSRWLDRLGHGVDRRRRLLHAHGARAGHVQSGVHAVLDLSQQRVVRRQLHGRRRLRCPGRRRRGGRGHRLQARAREHASPAP